MLVDSHTHLLRLEVSPEEAVKSAAEVGVGAVVNIGTEVEDSQRGAELAAVLPNVYSTAGIHPHNAGTYTAAAFREKWNGAPLSQLFGFISSTMPKEQPGTLEPDEYAEVVAYLLKINGAPPGKSELPAEAAPLKKIRIAMPAARSKASGR